MCSNETTKSPTFAAANTLSHSVLLSPTAALTARVTGEAWHWRRSITLDVRPAQFSTVRRSPSRHHVHPAPLREPDQTLRT
jgi:hypothetical protein